MFSRIPEKRRSTPTARLLTGTVAGLLAVLIGDLAYELGEWMLLSLVSGLPYTMVAAGSTYGWTRGSPVGKAPLYGAVSAGVAGLGVMLYSRLWFGAVDPSVAIWYGLLGLAGGLAITLGRRSLATLIGVIIAWGVWGIVNAINFIQNVPFTPASPMLAAMTSIVVVLSPAVAATAWIVALSMRDPARYLSASHTRGEASPPRSLPSPTPQSPAITQADSVPASSSFQSMTPLPTWTVGDTWTYRDFADAPFTLRVAEVSSDHYVVEKSPDHSPMRSGSASIAQWIGKHASIVSSNLLAKSGLISR